ncbi:HAMP domain-containing histidine kinase [Teredinibacter franksiae]|uniref:HAMP domain-containing histidine kinase n=1 Tax=Teredinibacter franksiae TaxID=2761453 RepID=UPI0016253473|nr:HAMP domain-containing histidine kinase [Teredinibacter franksiae]
MFNFFLPSSKVQKDRSIMRETDSRMAKYSRRGLIFNFCAYLICLVGGRFVDENRDLTITLTIGLLFITIVRGFFLFRFDQLYPRAPQRWRQSYFIATLLGAFWWAVILVSITLKLGMQNEAPLLWLYTVVFFSTTAHAFAPYQKFLSYYQFVGIVPAAISALFVDNLTAYLYGILMLVFYFVLAHQCRLISENYWERLEAAYALARKTQSMEVEKRDTRASAQLNREFLTYLRNDLHGIFVQSAEALKGLDEGSVNRMAFRQCERDFKHVFLNVSDFNSVLNKELKLANKVFNIRHELQHIVAEYIDDAEANGIRIETALSPTLPMRLKGDASRLAQIIRTLLSLSIQSIEKGVILVEVEFLREYENAGELYINISSFDATLKKRLLSENIPQQAKVNLALAVAKGLSDMMNGGIEISDIPNEGILYRFDAKFDVAEQAGHLDFHKNSFTGRSVMLIESDRRIVDIKRRELTALGFDVYTEGQFKRALQQLSQSYKDSRPIESVLFYYEEGQTEASEFSHAMATHPELRNTHQLVVATDRQQKLMLNQGFTDNAYLHYVNKPAGLFELESTFKEVYAILDEAEISIEDVPVEALNVERKEMLLISRRENAEVRVRETLEGLNFELTIISKESKIPAAVKAKNPAMALVDCDEEPNFIRIVDAIRAIETEEKAEFYIPIIGISSSSSESESTAYELGVDDFIDMSNTKKHLRSVVENWLALTNDIDDQ